MVFKDIFSSQENYFKWRLEKVKRISVRYPEIFYVKGKKILDIGCGAEAPLSFYLSSRGAKVYAGDFQEETVKSAKLFAKKAKITKFSAENLPFKDNSFDFVYLLDVLEHIKNPARALSEAVRVAKKNAKIFIEFSPYYAYPTGHHLYGLGFPKGFLPFQIIPKKISRKIILNTKLNTKDTPEFLYWQFSNLNKLSICEFRIIINKLNARKVREDFFISLPHGEAKINFVKYLPLIREIAGMSYACILRKI